MTILDAALMLRPHREVSPLEVEINQQPNNYSMYKTALGTRILKHSGKQYYNYEVSLKKTDY